MLKRFTVEPSIGIILATTLILVLSGTRLLQKWDDVWSWREPGLLATLLVGGLSAVALAFARTFRRRPRIEIYQPEESAGGGADHRSAAAGPGEIEEFVINHARPFPLSMRVSQLPIRTIRLTRRAAPDRRGAGCRTHA